VPEHKEILAPKTPVVPAVILFLVVAEKETQVPQQRLLMALVVVAVKPLVKQLLLGLTAHRA
jgi:hypothetical protein